MWIEEKFIFIYFSICYVNLPLQVTNGDRVTYNINLWFVAYSDISSVCLSIGPASETPKLIHYGVVLFHTPDIGLIYL